MVRVTLDKPSEKKAKVAALLRAADRFAEGNVAIGGLLLPMEGVIPSLTDEPWRLGLETAFSELKDRYDAAMSSGEPPPTMADGDIAAVVGRLHQLLRSYLVELQVQSENDSASAGNDVAVEEGTKSVVARIALDPEDTLVRVEVVIGTGGQGGVGATFFQFSGEHDREAEAALLQQAAEMLLEHAETTRNRPDPRRTRPPE